MALLTLDGTFIGLLVAWLLTDLDYFSQNDGMGTCLASCRWTQACDLGRVRSTAAIDMKTSEGLDSELVPRYISVTPCWAEETNKRGAYRCHLVSGKSHGVRWQRLWTGKGKESKSVAQSVMNGSG
jgi:hypothetical protein